MASDIEQKRQAYADAYPGEGWKAKVRAMPDDQSIALWFSLRKQGKIPW